MIPLTAPYLGERVENFEVYGGKYDTMGFRKRDPLPKCEAIEEHQRKVERVKRELPPSEIIDAAKQIAKRTGGDYREIDVEDATIRAIQNNAGGPSFAEVRDHVKSAEFVDAKKRRAETAKQNRLKRRRAAALNRGENINMKRDRLPGDPKI